MREANRLATTRAQEELSRLKVEGAQIEEALARLGRPGRSGRGSLTREQVYEAAIRIEPPMTASEVQQLLAQNGHEASVNAVRNHLNRLVKSGQLERHDDGRYVVKRALNEPHFSTSAADDDIPF